MHKPSFSILALVLLFGSAHAGPLVFTSNPAGAWSLSEIVGVGQGNSTNYVPLRNTWAGASFVGFVEDQSFFGPFGSGDEDTTRIFSTYVYADHPTTVNVLWGHDDGGAFYLNGELISATASTAGPGAGLAFIGDLHFQEGQNLIEMAVYNGPGLSSINFGADPTAFSTPISGVQGIQISAVAVPEPSAFTLLVTGVICLGSVAFLRIRFRQRDQVAISSPLT